MTKENKFEIVTRTHAIRKLCDTIDGIVLGNNCFASGHFNELEYLLKLAQELGDLNEKPRGYGC